MSSTANFERLNRLVAKHETFWAALAQRSQGNQHNEAVIKAWLTTQWDPWFTAYGEATSQGPLTEAGISAAARGLTALRIVAQSPQWQIPVPKISEETSAATAVSGRAGGLASDSYRSAGEAYSIGGRGGGGGGGHITHPIARPRPAAYHRPAYARPAHARPQGFRGRGGWYRHGSRFPGRWWWGPAGWVWVESDVNLVAPEEAAYEDGAPEAAPTPDEQPIAPAAQGEPADDVSTEAADDAATGQDADSAEATDGASVTSGADGESNPIVDAINDETNRRFWQQTGYHVGQPLDRANPRDRRMLPAWLRIRYQVALDFSARSREAYARGESLDEGDVRTAPRETPLARATSPSSLYAQSQSDAPVTSSGSLVALGAIVSPGSKGTKVTFTRDGSILTATICVDGRCSSGSIDLGPMHVEMHAAMHRQPLELVGASAIEYALVGADGAPDPEVGDAGRVLVGKLLHDDAVALCGSWWHSITSTVRGVGREVQHTIHKIKGPLGVAAGVATGAAAMAVPGAGPVLAPMAASLAHSMVEAAAGDQSAAKVVQQAAQQATSDATVSHALALATKSAAQTTAAAHVVQTVDQAIQGSPTAQAAVQELQQAANQGDASAQQMIAVAQQVAQGTAQDAAVSSGAVPDWRSVARRTAERTHGQVIGFAKPIGNDVQVKTFDSSDDADDWFGRWVSMPQAFEYIAYFDKGDMTFPGPLNEQWGAHHAAAVSSGHWLLPMALGGALGAGGVAFGPRAYAWAKGKISAREAATK